MHGFHICITRSETYSHYFIGSEDNNNPSDQIEDDRMGNKRIGNK